MTLTLNCCFFGVILFIVAAGSAKALEPKEKLLLQQIFSSPALMSKRRGARELLGKRSDPEMFERPSRRARELLGKRSAFMEEFEAPRPVPSRFLLSGAEEASFEPYTPNRVRRSGRELFGKRSELRDFDEDNILYLMSVLNNRRERRARSNELLG